MKNFEEQMKAFALERAQLIVSTAFTAVDDEIGGAETFELIITDLIKHADAQSRDLTSDEHITNRALLAELMSIMEWSGETAQNADGSLRGTGFGRHVYSVMDTAAGIIVTLWEHREFIGVSQARHVKIFPDRASAEAGSTLAMTRVVQKQKNLINGRER